MIDVKTGLKVTSGFVELIDDDGKVIKRVNLLDEEGEPLPMEEEE